RQSKQNRHLEINAEAPSGQPSGTNRVERTERSEIACAKSSPKGRAGGREQIACAKSSPKGACGGT
ncbi:MAG: hypothetical protein ABI680_20025, partial [Chthoniobacteraceae bacterium]